MYKKLFLSIVLLTSFVNAQHTIKGVMQPEASFEWVILYQLQGLSQKYIENADIVNGVFTFTLPETANTGVYRLMYDIKNRLFVDVIYNNEDVSFTFDPKNPDEQIQFITSKENQIYHQYLTETATIQRQLDSLQVFYFSSPEKDRITKLYLEQHATLKKVQQDFELQSKNKMASHFIKASARYTTQKPIENPQGYLNSVKTHFFDFIDFNDKILLNSTFINDKIIDYIFYLNNSEDTEINTELQKYAISTVITKIGDNLNFVKDLEESLLYNFTQQQNVPMAKYMLENHYNKLPISLQDIAFKKDMKAQLKTVIGNKAPNILWTDNSVSKDLYSLTNAEYYVVVFWSSSCGHCLKEMPILYDYLKDNTKTKVIAVGLEKEETKADWETLIVDYKEFIHVYGANKWKNKFAREYGVNSTPSFFVLNANKKIVAKPYDVAKLKIFLEK